MAGASSGSLERDDSVAEVFGRFSVKPPEDFAEMALIQKSAFVGNGFDWFASVLEQAESVFQFQLHDIVMR